LGEAEDFTIKEEFAVFSGISSVSLATLCSPSTVLSFCLLRGTSTTCDPAPPLIPDLVELTADELLAFTAGMSAVRFPTARSMMVARDELSFWAATVEPNFSVEVELSAEVLTSALTSSSSAAAVSRVTFFVAAFLEDSLSTLNSLLAQEVTLDVVLASMAGRVWKKDEALSVIEVLSAERFSIVLLLIRSVAFFSSINVALIEARSFLSGEVLFDTSLTLDEVKLTRETFDANRSRSRLELERCPPFLMCCVRLRKVVGSVTSLAVLLASVALAPITVLLCLAPTFGILI
jgi:hypothetical protein